MSKLGNPLYEALSSFTFYREALQIAARELEMLKSHYFEIIGFFPRIVTSTFADVVINSVEEFIKNQEKGSTKNGMEQDIKLTLQLLLQELWKILSTSFKSYFTPFTKQIEPSWLVL